MAQRDKLKGHLIGCIMAKHGCTFELAECVYDLYLKNAIKFAVGLAVTMVTKKVIADLTGQQTIGHN